MHKDKKFTDLPELVQELFLKLNYSKLHLKITKTQKSWWGTNEKKDEPDTEAGFNADFSPLADFGETKN